MKTDIQLKDIKTKRLKNSEVEITGEISKEIVEGYRKEALAEIIKNIEIPGFRKGQVPEKMVSDRVGEMAIWGEMAELALKDAYPKLITEQKIDVIGQPEITITKLAPGNDLSFKINTAVFPEIKLGPYLEIAKKIFSRKTENFVTEEKEVDRVISKIIEQQKTENGQVPELNDEFARSLGNFKDLEHLKEQIRNNLKLEKERREKDKKRMEAMEDIVKRSTIEMPVILIEGELERMTAQFREELEMAGADFNQYLEKTKTTQEKLREDWRPQAEKRAKIQLILNKIAEEQKIKLAEKDLEIEVGKILSEYPEANRERARIFVETILKNEEVFKLLESQK